jgi:solute carrier family 30 (zinc transporter), member 1
MMFKLTRTHRLGAMLVMTGLYFVVELVVGVTTGSLALLADSFHMLSDVLALTAAAVALRMAKRSATATFTYGFQRAELLGALANGIFLLALCFTIAVDAISRLINPEAVNNPRLVVIVGLVGLMINVIGMFLFTDHGHHHGHSHGHVHGHSHSHAHSRSPGHSPDLVTSTSQDVVVNAIVEDVENPADHYHEPDQIHDLNHVHHHGLSHVQDDDQASRNGNEGKGTKTRKSLQSLNMQGVFLHVAGDFLGSVVVVVSAVAMWRGDFSWENRVDPIASLVIDAILIYACLPLVFQTGKILLNQVPHHIDIASLRRELMALPDVIGIHENHVWALSDHKIVASCHVKVAKCCQFNALSPQIKQIFHAAGIHSTTIQPEQAAPSSIAASQYTSDDAIGISGDRDSPSEDDCLLRCEPEDCAKLVCCPKST